MKNNQNQKKEIIWNIVNSLIAGSLVFLGALTSGNASWESIGISLVASLIVALTRFKDYWAKEEKEYSCVKCGLFHFL